MTATKRHACCTKKKPNTNNICVLMCSCWTKLTQLIYGAISNTCIRPNRLRVASTGIYIAPTPPCHSIHALSRAKTCINRPVVTNFDFIFVIQSYGELARHFALSSKKNLGIVLHHPIRPQYKCTVVILVSLSQLEPSNQL